MLKHRNKTKKGYTLIELSVVIVLVVLIATTLVAMVNQQMSFFRWWRSQDFVAEDAPLINNVVVRVFSKADVFKIYEDSATLLANGDGDVADCRAMLLGFTGGDGLKEYGMMEYTADSGLRYHVLNENRSAIVSTWTISNNMADAQFDVVGGMMNLTLTGPYGGQLTYAATPSL